MACEHTTREVDCRSPSRRNLGALLQLAIASLLVSLLIACGGGGADGGGGGGSTGPNSAVLEWDAVTGANGYRIYYGTVPGNYLQSVGQGVDVGNVTTFTVTGLSSATTYCFAATAYVSTNESFFSNEVCKDIP